MQFLTTLSTTLVLCAGVAGAAHAETAVGNAVGGAVQETKTKLFDAFDKDSITVDFKNGSAALEQGEIDDLKALLTSNKRDGKLERVIVASWSDKDYPANKGERLGDSDRKLADDRSAAVKKALAGLGAATVDTYSMAEHPTWMAKAFNTKDAKVKGQGTMNDADDSISAELGKRLKDKGGPEKAVVIIRRAGDFTVN